MQATYLLVFEGSLEYQTFWKCHYGPGKTWMGRSADRAFLRDGRASGSSSEKVKQCNKFIHTQLMGNKIVYTIPHPATKEEIALYKKKVRMN